MLSSETIAVSSMIVATLAFFATAWQAYISRRHNVLSVQPIIEHNYSLDFQDLVKVSVLNSGLGPAVVFDLKFKKPGLETDLTATDLVKHFEALMIGTKFEFEAVSILHNTVVRPGESLQLFSLRRLGSDLPSFAKAVSQLDHYLLIVKYKSMYGETYRYEARTRVA